MNAFSDIIKEKIKEVDSVLNQEIELNATDFLKFASRISHIHNSYTDHTKNINKVHENLEWLFVHNNIDLPHQIINTFNNSILLDSIKDIKNL
jgi:hypothetical protein